MRITLDVKDEKAAFLLEILRNFKFVKLDETSDEKSRIIEDLKAAVREVKRERQGKVAFKTAEQLFNEL